MPEVRFCSACGAPLPVVAAGHLYRVRDQPLAESEALRERDRRRATSLLARRAYTPWKDVGLARRLLRGGEHRSRPSAGGARGDRPRPVTGYVGVWVDAYADERAAPNADVINVAYYTAEALGGDEAAFDRPR